MEAERSRYLQLARFDGRGRILDITDPERYPRLFDPSNEDEKSPKYQLNYTRYDTEAHKALVTHRHWIDEDTLSLLCYDIVRGFKGMPRGDGFAPLLDEFKGGRAS